MRHVLIHGHIFKNAGTTFDWSLARSFGEDFLDHREDRQMREQAAKCLRTVVSAAPGLRAVSSHHMCYPLPDMSDIAFHPVYLLRHPIERIASVYAFERQQDSQSLGAIAAKEKNFQEYVSWRMQNSVPRTIRDYQACNVSGLHDDHAKAPAPVQWLRRSVNHLASIDCVGVVDRYDESMVVFEHQLSAFFPDIDLAYIRQNVTQRETTAMDLASRVQACLERLGPLASEVISNNSYDLALYRQANQKLDEAFASVPDAEVRLAQFRERCSALKAESANAL
jgi:hypothetical protein